MDEAGYEDKHLLHDISCLPLIVPAPVSGVLSPKSVHATVSLSEFWSKVPQRNVEVFNRVGPTGDVAQVTKHTRNLLLASWTDLTTPLKSVLDSTKLWCAGNLAGKVEMFATVTIARNI